jgi:hypothetical protein
VLRVASVVAVVLAVAACSDATEGNEPVPEAPITLTRSGGCGDAYLWAATDDGTVAVTISVDAIDRSSAEPTTIAIDLPQDDVEAFVLRGDRDMTGNFCTDLIDGDAEPDEILPLRAGTGEIVLDPLPDEGDVDGCGDIAGRATLTGLTAEDGMPFEPVSITTTDIGCYAG